MRPKQRQATYSPHCRIQLGEAVGQPGPIDNHVGDTRQKFPCGRKLAGGDVSLVNLGFRGREIQFQPDPEWLGQILLFKDGVERTHLQIGQLTDVVFQAWLGDRNRDVVFQSFLYRSNDDR